MQNACIIAEWFVNEAKRIYAALGGGRVDGELTAEQREVMKVLGRINKSATPREMKRASRVLQRMDNLDEVMRELVRLGRLQEQFRNDGYHHNGALEYLISSVDTVDADTMFVNAGENGHAVNADTVFDEEAVLSAPGVVEGFDDYQDPEPAVIEPTATEAVMVEPVVIKEEIKPEGTTETELAALVEMLRTSQQPIPFLRVLSHFDGDRVPACQFLRDNGFEISGVDTGEQVIFVPEKVQPSAGRQKPTSRTSSGGKYETITHPDGRKVRINNYTGIKGKMWD
jgi:hypothetical protein